MNFRKNVLTGSIVSLALAAAPALGAVSEEEAAKLGNELTPIGAKKAGNGDEIPAWDGGLTTPPDNFEGNHYLDPFPEDEPLFVIDQSNVDEYKDRLTPGQVKMINEYEDYKMPVYKTRRTAALPERIYEKAKKNATNTTLVEGGNGLENFDTAVPFPIPENGLQVIWNHTTRYRGGAVKRNVHQAVPQENGAFTPIHFDEEFAWRTSLQDYDPSEDSNVLFYFKQAIRSPSRLAGNVLLVHETINQVKEPRRAWVYNAGQRRVRRAPQVAYDGPGTASDGQRTSDNLDMFNGAPDRYNWELKGKKEMYIPYNGYRLDDPSLSYDELLEAGHINQDHARYELHRVWHVTATLKDDERHIYAKRDFYIDEDTWGAAVVDHYDGRGELWRVAEGHAMQYYDQKVPWYAFETLYDTLNGRYLVLGLTNEMEDPYTFGIERQLRDYTPSALRRAGRR
ncbi:MULTISPECIES: DUF1329 domain-containing protein [Halomonadaceae]|uniref:DUF1329 domain-containing protein n=1 Tax=Vreelandella halophila TaxID=86177 RepID=A0A9X4Y8N3_9GAMM|nr:MULTISPECIES: DUF1329 domain-containing protein [Halomonas]MYL25522.1 DUF1329 domain-containing protein [Halomonas utahensis]MYL74758.1 DUF1329 domain-containing protein [Halomonas sp. 22501_18_FS]